MKEELSVHALLSFYADIGVDVAVCAETTDYTKVTEIALPPVVQDDTVTALPRGTIESLAEAEQAAAAATTLDELRQALEDFKGLLLKRSATQMVFADGNPQARIMIIGERPNADEDRSGRPFSGANGVLLDKMLAAIGLDRASDVYLTNIVNWRPPGNRAPTESEIALSLPFIRRHIELVNPAVIVMTGGAVTKALLSSNQSIVRQRGKWTEYASANLPTPVPVLPFLHPEFLIATPREKARAWQDLQSLQAKTKTLNTTS